MKHSKFTKATSIVMSTLVATMGHTCFAGGFGNIAVSSTSASAPREELAGPVVEITKTETDKSGNPITTSTHVLILVTPECEQHYATFAVLSTNTDFNFGEEYSGALNKSYVLTESNLQWLRDLVRMVTRNESYQVNGDLEQNILEMPWNVVRGMGMDSTSQFNLKTVNAVISGDSPLLQNFERKSICCLEAALTSAQKPLPSVPNPAGPRTFIIRYLLPEGMAVLEAFRTGRRCVIFGENVIAAKDVAQGDKVISFAVTTAYWVQTAVGRYTIMFGERIWDNVDLSDVDYN